MSLDPSQQRAVELSTSAPFAIVTGGPGTGKSTTLRNTLDVLDARGESYLLAAPTGKAAKRMSEATGRKASTIHRMLGSWGEGRWQHNAENKLSASAVFIDEASMLDIELAAALFEACSDETRIVLIGDANQLPSVGPGRVFADLVESGAVPVARLEHVHRAAAESWVCTNAPKILTGRELDLRETHDFRFCEVDSAQDVADAVLEAVSALGESVAQVLTPQKNTACGVEALNKALQLKLRGDPTTIEHWKVGSSVFCVGDRVIQTVNNYAISVFNGEVGTVRAAGDELMVDFGDERIVEYTKAHSTGLDLAYALTVHKSQGSEFPWVVCVLHSAHSFMLDRQIAYTAITRAKKGVVIVGNRKGLSVATGDKQPRPRNTGLVSRIRASATAEEVGV